MLAGSCHDLAGNFELCKNSIEKEGITYICSANKFEAMKHNEQKLRADIKSGFISNSKDITGNQ